MAYLKCPVDVVHTRHRQVLKGRSIWYGTRVPLIFSQLFESFNFRPLLCFYRLSGCKRWRPLGSWLQHLLQLQWRVGVSGRSVDQDVNMRTGMWAGPSNTLTSVVTEFTALQPAGRRTSTHVASHVFLLISELLHIYTFNSADSR